MYMPSRKKAKFSNQAIEVGGLQFDSKLEQRIYAQLILISNIESVELHKSFDLIVNDTKICRVEPDFTVHLKSGVILYADAKSNPTETAISSLKFKLFRALYGKKIWILPREMCDFLDLCGANKKYDAFLEVRHDNTDP